MIEFKLFIFKCFAVNLNLLSHCTKSNVGGSAYVPMCRPKKIEEEFFCFNLRAICVLEQLKLKKVTVFN